MTKEQVPTIGITCLDDRPTQDQHPPRFGQSQTYVHALTRAGAASLLIPPLTDKTLLRTVYDLVDGLLLSGGDDVDPAYYGEPLHEKCGPVSRERDEFEFTLIRWAMDEGKPLLAICRGIQVLNVALGGSLYQDIQAQAQWADKHDRHPDYPRDRLFHTVIVAPQTRLAHILGTAPLTVSSSHHQAVKDVAPGLAVAARASDNMVEAVEAESHPFAIGVQWHPEALAESDVRAQRLFDTLVDVCQTGLGLKALG
ncbi:MAG: gamma-glutamyl-gamma-aminobutyrate hydrolase family protein [Anaerolineae bacterium]